MIVDCHTHLWRYPAELSEALANEMFIMRRQEVELDITPAMHADAVRDVDRAIVFGLRAPLTGFCTVNRTVADYVRTDPNKLIGFAAVCPTEPESVEQVECLIRVEPVEGSVDDQERWLARNRAPNCAAVSPPVSGAPSANNGVWRPSGSDFTAS